MEASTVDTTGEIEPSGASYNADVVQSCVLSYSRISWEGGMGSVLELQQSLGFPSFLSTWTRPGFSHCEMDWSVYFLGHIIFEYIPTVPFVIFKNVSIPKVDW